MEKAKNKEKVTMAVALNDVHKWLEHKRVSEKKIEDNEDNIQTLAEAIVSGDLHLESDTHKLVQKLKFELGKEEKVAQLVYKPRLKVGEVETRLQKVKAGNVQGMINAYVCALTDTNSGVIKDLDTEDGRIANAIASFFL